MDRYVTEPELAEMLQVSRTFLWEMRANEGLPHCRLGRALRYNPKAVADWLAKHEHQNYTDEELSEGGEK